MNLYQATIRRTSYETVTVEAEDRIEALKKAMVIADEKERNSEDLTEIFSVTGVEEIGQITNQ